MSRRIEIELTSSRPDGSWTWRAAGAREPKGVLDGTLLSQGSKPGDVVKAEAEFDIDGITIVSITQGRVKVDKVEKGTVQNLQYKLWSDQLTTSSGVCERSFRIYSTNKLIAS